MRVGFLTLLFVTLLSPAAFADSILQHFLIPTADDDEAMIARIHGQLSQSDFELMVQGSSEDYFKKMDYGVTLPENQENLRKQLDTYIPGITAAEATQRVVRGRDNWIVWTGGNDRFWNYMSRATLGGFDLIKTISDHPKLPSTRSDRWQLLGLVNEPCFDKATGPNPDRFGLWLPKRKPASAECPADPFEDEQKYPGVKIGARGTDIQYKGQKITFPVGSFYGYATGVVGLRLFPNPDFDAKAAAKWDPDKYYNDPAYYYDPNLIRPYRVGMACAFCHVGPNPSRPPADFNNPKWENLNSNPGAQYFWVDRIFDWDWKKNQDFFVVQLLKTSRPGTLDTSLVSSDMINNPRSMNAVYDLPARVATAMKFNHLEQLKGEELNNAQFSLLAKNVVPDGSTLRGLYSPQYGRVLSPRVLKDGSDSVGALGALNRVYLNIGLFSEDWVKHFIPLIGGWKVTPIKIQTANEHSLYWQANVAQTPDVGLFFLAASRPDKLSEAPGGMSYLKDFNGPEVTAGKRVFARNCAACHSSKLPEEAYDYFKKADPLACVGKNYMGCWSSYWSYVQTPRFKNAMEKKVLEDPDFLKSNYLSTELRVPVTLLDTYLCSPIATNAIEDNIWDNFSSRSYKDLPSLPEKFRVNYPTGARGMTSQLVTVPGGGRGFMRPASLISVWSTAPFLQNNSVGTFDWHGTVQGRLASFNDSINKMLNPELRANDKGPGKWVVPYTTTGGDKLNGIVDVTTEKSYLKIPKGYLPPKLWNIIKDVIDKEPGLKDQMGKGKGFTQVDGSELKKYVAKPFEPVKRNWLERQWASVFGKSEKTELSSSSDEDVANYAGDEMGEFIRFGPIPAGVPVNMLANLNLELITSLRLGQNIFTLNDALVKMGVALLKIKLSKLDGQAARDTFMSIAGDALVKADKCNDFVVNRGHYFGSLYSPDKGDSGHGLSQEEKASLIEYLKWM